MVFFARFRGISSTSFHFYVRLCPMCPEIQSSTTWLLDFNLLSDSFVFHTSFSLFGNFLQWGKIRNTNLNTYMFTIVILKKNLWLSFMSFLQVIIYILLCLFFPDYRKIHYKYGIISLEVEATIPIKAVEELGKVFKLKLTISKFLVYVLTF